MKVLIPSKFGQVVAGAVCILSLFSQTLCAGPPRGAGRSYPLVYGATGRPYGPTQAEYQYQLRYGRPWRGGGGGYRGSSTFYSGSSLGLQYISPFGYPEYSPIYGLNVPYFATPNVVYSGPVYPQFGAYGYFGYIPGVPTINHVPYQVGNGTTMIGNGFQPDPFEFENSLPQNQLDPEPVVEESSPEQIERATRERVLGDEDFARTDYLAADEHYRQAMRIAPDQADPRYRLAISLAARSRFDEAVEQLRLATQIDMDWPLYGVTLNQLYGIRDQNDAPRLQEKERVKTRIAEWTNRDVRDPNRLFLLAAVMVLDGDVRAKGLLETAIRLNGVERHLVAFLRPMLDAGDVAGDPQPTPVKPLVVDPAKAQRGFVPPVLPEGNGMAPSENRGEITGAEREKRVFEKPADPIPALPEELKELPDPPIPPKPGLLLDEDDSTRGPALPPR